MQTIEIKSVDRFNDHKQRYIQVGITLTGVLDVVRFAEVHDAQQSVAVTSERSPSSQQDQIQRSVLVLISELDRSFTNTTGGVVVASHVAVSATTTNSVVIVVFVAIFRLSLQCVFHC